MPDVITGTSKKKSAKWVVITIVIVVLLAGAGVGAWYWWQQQHKSTSDTASTSNTDTATKVDTSKVADTQKKAFAAANTQAGGSVQKASDVYDEAIKSTPASDTGTLASLYNGKAQLYLNNNQPQNALTAQQKAVELDPSGANYVVLADSYAAANQKDTAITTYKKAIDILTPQTQQNDGPGAGAMILYCQRQIKALGGSL